METEKNTLLYTYTNYYKDRLFTLHDILSPYESINLIDTANYKGWNESSPSGGGHGRTGNELPRTNKFCVLYNSNLASQLWNKINNFLSHDLAFLGDNVYFNSITKGTEWNPAFIYDKFRIYKYNVGDVFPEHIDYKMKRTIVKDNKEYVEQSFLTLLIYLNDDFEGGKTGYWTDLSSDHKSSKKEHNITITPYTGMCVIQDQNILHEGLPPTKGVKYILRTDIIYRKEVIRDKRIKVKLLNDKIGEWERLFEPSCKNYAD